MERMCALCCLKNILSDVSDLLRSGGPGAALAQAGMHHRSRTEKARAFIDAISRMNRALGIPERFPCIRPEDLPQMAARAEAEANPVYPVPVIFSKEDFIRVARWVMP